MPPPKRKRPERGYSGDANEQRPSPHRPQNMNLAQQGQANNSFGSHPSSPAGRGGRRGSGRGGAHRPSGAQQAPLMVSPAGTPVATPTAAPAPMPVTGTQQQQPVTQTQQTAVATPTPTPKPAPAPAPKAAPVTNFFTRVPYHYQHVTNEAIADWEGSKDAVKAVAVENLQKKNMVGWSTVFQELIRSVLAARLAPELAGALVQDILEEDKDPEGPMSPSRHFIDCFATMVEPGMPDVQALRDFLSASGISHASLREQLEIFTLQQLGLVRPTFQQMGARHTTKVLYKQTTYNLLREDTEGYAKLISEYYLAAERGPATADSVSDAFQKVKALVGAFNLDPGRTLDVTLDVFGDLLVKRHRFFMRYLRASSFWPQDRAIEGVVPADPGFSTLPWWTALDYEGGYNLTEEDKTRLEDLKLARDAQFWDRVRSKGIRAFFELSGRRVAENNLVTDGETAQEKDLDQQWVAETNTLPPRGNKIAAQLLGYKLRYYASDYREDAQLPENIIWLAALLIHTGFISLKDLYPHLYPADETMDSVKEKLQKEKVERDQKKRPGGGMNALMMAGALVDDTLPAPSRMREAERKSTPRPETANGKKTDGEDETEVAEPENQKIMLLKALLLIGAIPDALFMLGRFPWLLDLVPELNIYIFRIIKHSLHQISNEIRPLPDRESIREAKSKISEASGLPRGQLKVTKPEPRRVLKWGKLDSTDSTNATDYKFYWEDWQDNVPVCRSVDDLFSLCSSFLNLAGVRIGEDAEIPTKIARIGIWSLAEDKSEANTNRWIDLSKRLLVPALSFSRANPGAVAQVWELIRQFPISTRYSIYAEWFNGQVSRTTPMKDAFELSRAETKDVLKRISKQNTKEMARALAKIATSSPGIVFQVTLNQIEAYDNLIAVVVECARYFTTMGYDILSWSILTSIGAGDRDRTQSDGMLTSQWLRLLSQFAGEVSRRYSIMNPTPILRYVASQLRKGSSEDLEILEQIVISMAGIKADSAYSATQIQLLTGGPLFRGMVLKQIQDNRHDPKNQAKRFIKALHEAGLAGQLLLLVAQERQFYPFRESSANAPLKVLGNNLDKIHRTFIQYFDTLRFNMSDAEFTAVVPGLARLIKDFRIDAPVAFLICRETLRQKIIDGRKQRKEELKAAKETNGKAAIEDVEMKEGEAESAEPKEPTNPAEKASENEDGEDKAVPETNGETPDVQMKDVPVADDKDKDKPPATPTEIAPLTNPDVQGIAESLRNVLPANFEENFSLQFYVWFWSLAPEDIYYPEPLYTKEYKGIKETIDKLKSRRENTAEGSRRKDAESKKLLAQLDTLAAERGSQAEKFFDTQRDLRRERGTWFANIPWDQHKVLADNIVQNCILPRAILSPLDAFYAYEWVFMVHKLAVPGFRTIQVLDRIFRENFLKQVLFQCTAREAENFGYFLFEVLRRLAKWHKNDKEKDPKTGKEISAYEKDALGPKKSYVGLTMGKPAGDQPPIMLEFEDFRRLLFKWHTMLSNALKGLFSNGEFMHVRNAIITLKSITSEFPRVNFQGDQLLKTVQALSKDDPREDLKLAAMSLFADLKKYQTKWKPVAFFREGNNDVATKVADKGSTVPTAAPAKLDPAVKDFKPSTGSKPAPSSNLESEDGEINDSRKSNTDVPPPRPAPSDRANGSRAADASRAVNARLAANGLHPSSSSLDNRRNNTNLATPPASHALPTRPDSQVPTERIAHSQTESDRGGRDYRNDGPPAVSSARDRGRALDSPDTRSRNRTPDAPPARGRDLPPARAREPPHRESRELLDRNAPRDRGFAMPTYVPEPPRGSRISNTAGSSAPPLNAERAPLSEPMMRGTTPERPIRDPRASARDQARRYDDEADRRSSRSRHDEPPLGQPRPDPRSQYEVGPERPYDYPRDRRDDPSAYPPSRSERPQRGHDPDPSRRELFMSSSGARPHPLDANKGRLSSSDFPTRPPLQDPNHGRLPAWDANDSEPPSGPRVRGAATASRGRGNGYGSGPPTPNTANPPNPLSPRDGRYGGSQDRRDGGRREQSGRGPSAPSTPVGGAPELGIHPSRLEQMKVDTSQPPTPSQPSPREAPSGPRNPRQSGNYNDSPSAAPPSSGLERGNRQFANIINSHISAAGGNNSAGNGSPQSDRDRSAQNSRPLRGARTSTSGAQGLPAASPLSQPPVNHQPSLRDRTDRRQDHGMGPPHHDRSRNPHTQQQPYDDPYGAPLPPDQGRRTGNSRLNGPPPPLHDNGNTSGSGPRHRPSRSQSPSRRGGGSGDHRDILPPPSHPSNSRSREPRGGMSMRGDEGSMQQQQGPGGYRGPGGRRSAPGGGGGGGMMMDDGYGSGHGHSHGHGHGMRSSQHGSERGGRRGDERGGGGAGGDSRKRGRGQGDEGGEMKRPRRSEH